MLLYKTSEKWSSSSLLVFGPFVSEAPHDNSYIYDGPYYWSWHVWCFNGERLWFVRSFDYVERESQNEPAFDRSQFYAELGDWVSSEESTWIREDFLGIKPISD